MSVVPTAAAELPVGEEDPVKAESARIFKRAWDEAAAERRTGEPKAAHVEEYG